MWSFLLQLLRINLRVPFLESPTSKLSQRNVQPVAENVPKIAGRPQLKPHMRQSRLWMMMHTLRVRAPRTTIAKIKAWQLKPHSTGVRRHHRGPTAEASRRDAFKLHREEKFLKINHEAEPKCGACARESAEILPKDEVEDVELCFVVKFAR